MIRYKTFVVWLVVSSVLCGSVTAQQSAGGGRSNWNNLQKLKSGARIYVETKRGAEYEGDFRGTTDDALLLTDVEGAPGDVFEVARDEVRVVRKRRSKFVRGFIGAAAGAAVGIGTGVAIGAAIEARSPSDEDKGLASGLLGMSGGIAGASAGTRIADRKLKKGSHIYVAP